MALGEYEKELAQFENLMYAWSNGNGVSLSSSREIDVFDAPRPLAEYRFVRFVQPVTRLETDDRQFGGPPNES